MDVRPWMGELGFRGGGKVVRIMRFGAEGKVGPSVGEDGAAVASSRANMSVSCRRP